MIWNAQKWLYCKNNNINILFDDSKIYEEYFKDSKTKYILIEDN